MKSGIELSASDLASLKEANTISMTRDEARTLVDQVENETLMTALDILQGDADRERSDYQSYWFHDFFPSTELRICSRNPEIVHNLPRTNTKPRAVTRVKASIQTFLRLVARDERIHRGRLPA